MKCAPCTEDVLNPICSCQDQKLSHFSKSVWWPAVGWGFKSPFDVVQKPKCSGCTGVCVCVWQTPPMCTRISFLWGQVAGVSSLTAACPLSAYCYVYLQLVLRVSAAPCRVQGKAVSEFAVFVTPCVHASYHTGLLMCHGGCGRLTDGCRSAMVGMEWDICWPSLCFA